MAVCIPPCSSVSPSGAHSSPVQVEQLVADALSSPVRITVGITGAANTDVVQVGVDAEGAWVQGRATP